MADAKRQFVTLDKFNNPTVVIGCSPQPKNPTFNKGFVELGNQLYKLEVSVSKKVGTDYWVKITKLDKKRAAAANI